MKTELKRTIEVAAIFEAPLYGYDIGKVYSQKQKLIVKELVDQVIEKNLKELEYSDESVNYRVTSLINVKSLK